VEEAVRSEEAAVTMQRAVRRFLLQLQQQQSEERPRKRAKKSKAARRKKPKSQPVTTATASSTTITAYPPQQQQPHWLWRSLRAYSAQERAVSVQLLLSDSKLDTGRLLPHAVRFLGNLLMPQPQQPASAAAVEQTCAVVQHLLLGGTSVVSEDATAHVYRYWPWWCRQLYRCRSSATSTATAALAHTAVALVLRATVATADEQAAAQRELQLRARCCLWRKPLTSNGNNSQPDPDLSPLACLIGAHFFGSISGGGDPNRDLQLLVDPTSECVVRVVLVEPPEAKASSKGGEDEEKDPEHHHRLPPEPQQMQQVSSNNSSHPEEMESSYEQEEDEDDDDEDHHNHDEDDDEEGGEEGEDHHHDHHDEENCEEQIIDDDGEDEDGDDSDDASHGMIVDDEGHVVLEAEDAMDVQDDEVLIVPAAAPAAPKTTISTLAPPLPERRRLFVSAAMQVLSVQHQQLHHHHAANSRNDHNHSNSIASNYYCTAENELLKSVCQMVRPDHANKKQLLESMQVILRRAPTQEEFFRGSLSRNPVQCSVLMGGSHNIDNEPTVADLRAHIANDLQMADSAELIEILLCNKILNVNLKLRVVRQVLWKNHLVEGGSTGTSGNIFASGGSILLSSSGQQLRVTADTPVESLPPMVATYRLAGVDGEATEDTVDVLADPEAVDEAATAEEREERLEAEYSITRLVTEGGRGVVVLLRSIQNCVHDTLRRIRRDDVEGQLLLMDEDNDEASSKNNNPSRTKFKSSPPCHGLVLLRHCAKLASNRKLLLQARAPTVLLTLLLEVLKVLEGGGGAAATVESSSSNPTAEILQELIESLTSDISTTESLAAAAVSNDDDVGYESDLAQDAASMPLLLESIETIALSPPLRGIIAKLLPFLTYGQVEMSRELAQHFATHIDVEALARVCEKEGDNGDDSQQQTRSAILMNTFVQTAISLPANSVCNTLRSALINCGLVERLATFIVQDMPKLPAPWSPALWQRGELPLADGPAPPEVKRKGGKASSSSINRNQQRPNKAQLEDAWRNYYRRGGVRTAFKILTGLCRQHGPTQARIAMFADFLRACHWLEGTSDSSTANVDTSGMGLLAETLLDGMTEDNEEVAKMVRSARKKTQLRKKELAQERRNLMLSQMSNYRPAAGAVVEAEDAPAGGSVARSGFASILAPVVGLFQSNPASAGSTSSPAAASRPTAASAAAKRSSRKGKTDKSAEKPAWLAEAEMMEDETGLTCAVCQEGRTLQPAEPLGLYAYLKKISIPIEQCGSRASIDGFTLLKALPTSLPPSLFGSTDIEEWYITAKTSAENLSSNALPTLTTTSGSGRRNSIFTTTVSAGNGIHFKCHRLARQADRNHPKAPKSEWEGAALRNSRVACNIILPLVSSHSSKVPLMAVDTALTEHQVALTNMLGVTPKSLLWTVLHDVRFLILRMAYGESLSTDCGGGSIASNCQLIFYQFIMADMFDKDAQVDQPEHSRQARGLAAGLLSACAIVSAKDYLANSSSLTRAIADAAPMAAITSLVFHNNHADGLSAESTSSEEAARPHPKRQWLAGRDFFLQALLICAGRRHARGMEGSGCQSSSRSGGSRLRSSSFADWDETEVELEVEASASSTDAAGRPASSLSRKRGRSSSNKPTVEDFRHALRPMIIYYAIMDQLSSEFCLTMDDVQIQESAERMATVITECQRSRSIQELFRRANVTMNHDDIIAYLQKGMVVAY